MEQEQVLGLDLGTNSIGAALRNGKDFVWGGVYTFSKGFGMAKSGEFSLANQRTTYRSKRRLYNSRRYRKWELLKALIANDYCPLDEQSFTKWKNYTKGVGRIYPVDHIEFQNWIKMDFNNDGKPEFSSPYHLRSYLFDNQIDLKDSIERHKIGRALYHMAMRRGFKSSRKSGKNEESAIYKGSTDTTTTPYNIYKEGIEIHGTLGKYLATIEDGDARLRNRYTLRSDYHKEFWAILKTQRLSNSAFAEACEKAIFYQRPLRSQKGLVGKCPLEPIKSRCPESHPDFELFRALQFLNHLKYKDENDNMTQIPIEWIELLYFKLFKQLRDTCKFIDIRSNLNEIAGKKLILNYDHKRDDTTVSLCPIRSRIESVFSCAFEDIQIPASKTSKSGKNFLSGEDIWHAMFHFEDQEFFEKYCLNNLKLNTKQAKVLLTGWNNLRIGYSNLSLKAIRKILIPLKQGSVYSEAVLLAKVQDFIGKQEFINDYEIILQDLHKVSEIVSFDCLCARLANKLIFLSKLEDNEDSFDEHLVTVEAKALLGVAAWKSFDDLIQTKVVQTVLEKFETHFIEKADGSKKSGTVLAKSVQSEFAKSLSERYGLNVDEITKALYHHSNIAYYPDVKSDPNKENLLPSPIIPALKNPGAYKTLHKLRRVINDLLENGLIDQNTRVVVEIARSMNSKNERNAIEKFQTENAKINASAIAVLAEAAADDDFQGMVNPKSARDLEKFKIWIEQIPDFEKTVAAIMSEGDTLKRYKLWKEQNGICIYTGRPISFTALFLPNITDFEHTIPRSLCFDNSLANQTITFKEVNRLKNNRIPSELENFKEVTGTTGTILSRLTNWKETEKRLFKSISQLTANIKATEEPSKKAELIQKRHVKKFEHDYWKRKLECFEIEKDKVNEGFRNSQLIDTQIITKYAYHFLKSVFYSVDSQVGETTSLFKEIYNVGEPNNAKKDRSKHTHHLEDAAVLTLLPRRTRMKKIMEAYFKAKEDSINFYDGYLTIGKSGVSNAIRDMVDLTLVNNLTSQDRTLKTVKKKVRKRGEVQYLDNSKTNPKIATGDAVRGQLHSETFYGKIKIAAKDESGSLLRNDEGSIQFQKDKNGKEIYKMVGRKSIMDVNFKTDLIIDDHLMKYLTKQIEKGVKQDKLKDFQGNNIRHLRCEVKVGGGKMNPENVSVIKEQTYKSKKEYKNYYYTNTGDNYMFGLYENENGRKIVPINTFESTQLSFEQNEDTNKEIFKSKEPVIIGRGKNAKPSQLKHIFIQGQKVLFFLESKEELKDLQIKELSKRLYYIKRFHQAERGNIVFQHHLEARSDDELLKAFGTKGKNGFAINALNQTFTPPRILFTPSQNLFAIECVDFIMNLDGSIDFKY